MIYKINLDESKISGLDPVGFQELGQLSKIEKDLENLIAENLLNKLFEDNALMPIYQEKSFQDKADIYALTDKGDLVLFELKRGVAGDDAMVQILRYTQTAGQWSYYQLNDLYQKDFPDKNLAESHKEAFELESELMPMEFNRNQHLFVIGSAANATLVKSVNYWKSKGISIEFIPYRIYNIAEQLYFEFFSKPHDIHINPNDIKGVILDTNLTYVEDGIWHMLENNRASVWGDAIDYIYSIQKNDYVFLSHKHIGIIAAGQVISNHKDDEDEEERYVNVKWLTKVPIRDEQIENYLSFAEVTEILEHGFYWAKTIKVPYLTKEECDILLKELREITG